MENCMVSVERKCQIRASLRNTNLSGEKVRFTTVSFSLTNTLTVTYIFQLIGNGERSHDTLNFRNCFWTPRGT